MPKKIVSATGAIVILLVLSLYLGSIPPSALYYLKVSRETIQTFFIFGDEDRANWLLIRADKRLTEAEKLKQKKLNFLADMQINTAKEYQSEAENILEVLKNKTNIIYLKDRLNQNTEKLKVFEGK